MSSVVQVLSPQAEELQAKRREMADLRRWFADKELELSTAKAELHLFERRYQNVVGPMYAELDRVKAQILGLACKFYPKAENFREEAESAREQADEFQEEIPSTEKPRKEFNPQRIAIPSCGSRTSTIRPNPLRTEFWCLSKGRFAT